MTKKAVSNPILPGGWEAKRPPAFSQSQSLIAFRLKGRRITLTAGAYLFRDQGPPGDLYPGDLYGVVHGVLRAERTMLCGHRQVLAYFEQGNVIGSALQLQAYSVVAVTSASLLCFTAETVRQAARASPLLASHLAVLTTRSIADIQDVVALQANYAPCDRLRAYLLLLFNHNPLRNKNLEILELPTSRRDIAEMLGIDIDILAGSMKTLQDQGTLLVHSARLLELLDRRRLENSVGRHPRHAPA
jgi:CRP/FNR family transcriptional regulator